MMGETHITDSPSNASGLFRRQLILMSSCALATFLCMVSTLVWISHTRYFHHLLGSASFPEHAACTGKHCHRVLSCAGTRGATFAVREPLASASGIVFFCIGISGILKGDSKNLHYLTNYLKASLALHLVLAVLNVMYVEVCSAYPLDLMYQTLLQSFPILPLGAAANHALHEMHSFPVHSVINIAGVSPLLLYVLVCACWLGFLAWMFKEACATALIMETAPEGCFALLGPRFNKGLKLDSWNYQKGPDGFVTPPLFEDVEAPCTAPASAALLSKDIDAKITSSATGEASSYGACEKAASAPVFSAAPRTVKQSQGTDIRSASALLNAFTRREPQQQQQQQQQKGLDGRAEGHSTEAHNEEPKQQAQTISNVRAIREKLEARCDTTKPRVVENYFSLGNKTLVTGKEPDTKEEQNRDDNLGHKEQQDDAEPGCEQKGKMNKLEQPPKLSQLPKPEQLLNPKKSAQQAPPVQPAKQTEECNTEVHIESSGSASPSCTNSIIDDYFDATSHEDFDSAREDEEETQPPVAKH